MQAVAAELAGYAGKFRCFWRGEFKSSLFQFFVAFHLIRRPFVALV